MAESLLALQELKLHIWQQFAEGINNENHGFKFPVLATVGAEGIRQRILTLREVEPDTRTLVTYSDYRTGKVADLLQNPKANWLFYNPETREQVRADANIILHYKDEYCRILWDYLPLKNRLEYLGEVSPGTTSQEQTSNLPDFVFQQDITAENTEQGFENFCVLRCEINNLDYLQLRKAGHLRAQYFWRDHEWKASWVAP